MILRACALRPAELAIRFLDRHIVDAGLPAAHQSVLVELPLLIAMGTEPVAGIVAVLIREAHRNPVLMERPDLLDQPVLELARPFAREKFHDLGPAREELRAVPPAAVLGIGER